MVEIAVEKSAITMLFHVPSASCGSWKVARYQRSEKPSHTVNFDRLKLKAARVARGAYKNKNTLMA